MSVTAGSDRWRVGYDEGRTGANDSRVEDFSVYQARATWDDFSAGYLAGWLDFQQLSHDRLRAVGSRTE